MMRTRISLLAVFLITWTISRGQEPQFTQFYAAPLYLNPAYTGADVCSRLSTNYRNQWPGIPGAFVSYALSFDHTIPSINSGVGILLTNDKAGSGNLRSTSIGVAYSYLFPINRSLFARAGIRMSETIRSIDFNNLVFGDQLVRGSNTTIRTPSLETVNYFDFSAGFLVYSSKLWAGIAIDHLAEPNQSLIGEESILPLKLSFHSGLKIPLGYVTGSKQVFLLPALNYKTQKDFHQLDIGVYFNNEPMIVGIWYRGIPFLQTTNETHFNIDAVAFLVGYQLDRLKIGYSYDLTLSNLIGSTGGSHEISVSYQFCDYNKIRIKKIKKYSAIPCPTF